MKPLIPFVLVFLLFASSSFAQERKERQLTAEQLHEEEAYSIGLQAYIYGYPIVEMYRTRYIRVWNPASKGRAPINHFRHAQQLVDHNYKDVVSPNNDTLYSSAWVDLSREPLILHLPDTRDRYHVFQLMDFYTNNVASVGKRTTGTKEGNFALVGPGWRGTLPEGIKRIDSPTNEGWLIGRTLVDGPKDLPAVRALQQEYTLTPLSAWRKSGRIKEPEEKPVPPPHEVSNPLSFFLFLNLALRANPPPAREAALMSLFGRINVGPDKTFQQERVDSATAKGLLRALRVGNEMIAAASDRLRVPVNGWLWPPAGIGTYGDNYLLRAEVARTALASLSPDDALYISGIVDDRGETLSGKHRYVLRFEKEKLPPVDGFWSITMYRLPQRLLVDNPLQRYSIGDRTEGLKQGTDGSLEIYIQKDSPGKEREPNWLPAPAGDFTLMLRTYVPRKPMLDGSWKLPPIKLVH
jgi:hypothetical protein